MKLLVVLAALQVASFTTTDAYPTAAGGCEGGIAAVGGSHVFAESVQDGTLDFGNFLFKINGERVRPNIPMAIPIGVEHEWEITGADAFRGFLVRLDGGTAKIDTTASLGPLPGMGGSVQVAETVCVDVYGVGGVTHRSRALKASAQGLLQLDEVSDNLKLDVTVVVENRNQNSEYYYTGYTLNAVDPSVFQPTFSPQDGDDDDDDDDDDEGQPQPTPAPTNARPVPSDPVSENDPFDESEVLLPLLQAVRPECSLNETCGLCQGDCDFDWDCAGRLACFQRDDWDFTEVPGCQGLGYMGMDYCYDPIIYPDALQTYPEDCSEDFPCGKCKGDCDADVECAGELECFQRPSFGNSSVPGCYGLGLAGQDYCFDRADMMNPDDFDIFTYPPTWAPTAEGEAFPTWEPTEAFTWEPTYESTEIKEVYLPPTDEPTEVYNPPTDEPTEIREVYVPPTREPTEVYNPPYEVYPPTAEPTKVYYVPPTMEPTDIKEVYVLPTMKPTIEQTYAGTPEGTREGTYEGTDYAANFLKNRDCSSYQPCDACEGDCDYDKQCKYGLECFPRRSGEVVPVPGCTGQGVPGHDYCYAADPNEARPRITPCSPQNPCSKCQGDCDKNADCAGNLKCFIREKGDGPIVPGCSGSALGDMDYCVESEYLTSVNRNGHKRQLRQRD